MILERPPGADPSPAGCDAGAGTWNPERGAKWILGNYGNTLYNHALPPNPPGVWDCMDVRQQKGRLAARSGHPGGVSVLFCDGGVRFVPDGTSGSSGRPSPPERAGRSRPPRDPDRDGNRSKAIGAAVTTASAIHSSRLAQKSEDRGMWRLKSLLLALAVVAAGPVRTALAGVVVNEVFYNAPDDIDDLQWVEVHNTSGEAVDLGGWTLDDGKVFTFPAKTTLGGNGYLVVALSPERFGKVYGGTALGPFKRPLKRGGEKLVLKDAAGKVADTARYKDRAPWPVERRRLLGVPGTHLPRVRRRHAGQLGRLAAPGDAEAGRHAREAERELLRHAPARRHAGGRADRPPAVPAPPGGSRRQGGREGGHAPVPGRRRRHRGEGGEPPDGEGGGRPVRGEHPRPGGGGARCATG